MHRKARSVAMIASAAFIIAALVSVGWVAQVKYERRQAEVKRIQVSVQGWRILARDYGKDWPWLEKVVKDLSQYDPDLLRGQVEKLNVPRSYDIEFFVRCYRLEPQSLAKVESGFASDDSAALAQGCDGLHCALSGGLGERGFAAMWSRLCLKAKRQVVRLTALGFTPWLNSFAGLMVADGDPKIEAYGDIIRLEAGDYTPAALVAKAQAYDNVVYRDIIGISLAKRGVFEGLSLLADCAMRAGPEQRKYILDFVDRFDPPPADVKRLLDPNADIHDLAETNWREWLDKVRKNDLEYRDRLYHVAAGQVKVNGGDAGGTPKVLVP